MYFPFSLVPPCEAFAGTCPTTLNLHVAGSTDNQAGAPRNKNANEWCYWHVIFNETGKVATKIKGTDPRDRERIKGFDECH